MGLLPGDALEEWLITVCLDCPVSNRDSDPVETCCSDICEVSFGLMSVTALGWVTLTHDKSLVVLFHHISEICGSDTIMSITINYVF